MDGGDRSDTTTAQRGGAKRPRGRRRYVINSPGARRAALLPAVDHHTGRGRAVERGGTPFCATARAATWGIFVPIGRRREGGRVLCAGDLLGQGLRRVGARRGAWACTDPAVYALLQICQHLVDRGTLHADESLSRFAEMIREARLPAGC